MVNDDWLELEAASYGSNCQPVIKDLNLGIDFSSLNVLHGIFFQNKVVLSTLKICCLVQLPSLINLDRSS